MRHYDMNRPCTNCPFRTDETAIRFATVERALEIAFTALLHGFPCHVTAEYVEEDEETDGYVFGQNTQHCAGYLIMQTNETGDRPWPGMGGDPGLAQRINARVDHAAPVFRSINDYLETNRDDQNKRHARAGMKAEPDGPGAGGEQHADQTARAHKRQADAK